MSMLNTNSIYIVHVASNTIYQVIGRNLGYSPNGALVAVSLNVKEVLPKNGKMTSIHMDKIKTGGAYRSLSKTELVLYGIRNEDS